jgi:FAD/FMN-containing dehydrogenase
MVVEEELIKVVGRDNVIDDPQMLAAYSGDNSFVQPVRPSCVVKPGNAGEVQAIVQWANKTLRPLVPVSSGPPHFRGDTVPGMGGSIIVDLNRMKRVIRVDRRNRVAMVESGVTFAELIPVLEKEGLDAYMPLAPRRGKSVVSSVLEREPITAPRYHWDSQDPLLTAGVIFGTGDEFKTGSAAGPSLEEQWQIGRAQMRPLGPGQFGAAKLMSGAQGTIGIVTWAVLKCSLLSKLNRTFLVPANDVESLIDLTYRLLKIWLGDKCLILNRHNLACLLAEDSEGVGALKEILPPWALIVTMEGYGSLPEERVEYQAKDFVELVQSYGLKSETVIQGVRSEDVGKVLSKTSSEPYWKLKFKGGCHDVFFLTTLDRTPEFVKTMHGLAQSRQYSIEDMGVYIQPTVQGCNCHCEFNLNCDTANKSEMEKVRMLVNEDAGVLANMGGFFSRPYGDWANFAYGRATETVVAQRKVKNIFDPNGIMNPGKLCF